MGLLARIHEESEVKIGRECPAWRNWDEVYDEGHGIIQIGLERTACFGECPVYTAVIHSNGHVEYHGDWYVERLGKYSGKISFYDFRCLAQFIQSIDFWELVSSYDFKDSMVSDCPSTYVMVATQQHRKVVLNYGDAGPPLLWAIAELIDSVLRGVTWGNRLNAEQSDSPSNLNKT